MRNAFSWAAAGILCFLVLPACGQGEFEQLDETASAEEGALGPSGDSLKEVQSALALSWQTATIPTRGGWGGSPTVLGCASGYVIVGIYGKSGMFIDRLGLVCGLLNADGHLSNQYSTGSVGGTGGFDFMAMCPSGQIAVGLRGRAAGYVDQLGLLCSSAANWVNKGPVQSLTTVAGGSGGTSFYDPCPASYALTQLYLRAAGYIDQEYGLCTLVNP